MSNISVRTYSEKSDLERVLSLYNSNPVSFPAFTRDEVFFKHFTSYPGVTADGIFVCESEGKIEGIAIIAVGEGEGVREGKIIELHTATDSATEMLSEKAFDYCCSKGADIVSVRPPMNRNVDKVFSKWMKIDSGVMMIKPLSLVPLVKELVGIRSTTKNSLKRKRLVLVLEEEIVEIDTRVEPISVSNLDEIPQNPDLLVKVSAKILMEIIFGLRNPYTAYLRGMVKVKGIKYVPIALRFLNSIKIGIPHVALVDGM